MGGRRVGGAGRVPMGRSSGARRAVLTSVLTGAGAFGAFYEAALIARHVPVLDRGIGGLVVRPPWLGAASAADDAGQRGGREVFFRGVLYDAAGAAHPVAVSAAVYALTTTPTGNPALVLAAVIMGALFGAQRRATGGIQAPLLTYLTWSTLMLRYLPRCSTGDRASALPDRRR